MNTVETMALLARNHQDFADFIIAQSSEEFTFAPEGKWTSGQQTDHLIRAIKPVRLGMRAPKFLLRLLFGKSNRPSKSYEALVAKYHQKLAAGGRATSAFIPPKIEASQQKTLVKKLLAEKDGLLKVATAWKEEDLDTFLMHHPLLGKLTIREMLYFTAYHLEHHLKSVKSF